MDVKVKKLRDYPADWDLPRYETDGAAGFDLKIARPEAVGYSPPLRYSSGMRQVFGTSLAFEIPKGFVMKIYIRSSIGKQGICLTNGVGIIDSDYRGEIFLSTAKLFGPPQYLKHGDRIAQGIIMPAPQYNLIEATKLSDTDRGQGGYGSTGK